VEQRFFSAFSKQGKLYKPVRLVKQFLLGDHVLSAVVRAIVAILVSILALPFGMAAIIVLCIIILPYELVPQSTLSESLKVHRRLLSTLGIIAVSCCLGTVAFAVACGLLDGAAVRRLSDFSRAVAQYSVFPNQLAQVRTSSLIADSDAAVLRSMFVLLLPPMVFAVWMRKLNFLMRRFASINVHITKSTNLQSISKLGGTPSG
jgi:hypothetical protein